MSAWKPKASDEDVVLAELRRSPNEWAWEHSPRCISNRWRERDLCKCRENDEPEVDCPQCELPTLVCSHAMAAILRLAEDHAALLRLRDAVKEHQEAHDDPWPVHDEDCALRFPEFGPQDAESDCECAAKEPTIASNRRRIAARDALRAALAATEHIR